MIIYKISSAMTERVYVGQTIRKLESRWAHHKWKAGAGARHPLYAAMRKYGIANFTITVLQELPDDTTQAELDAAEIHWIGALNSLLPTGWNVKPGGDGPFKMTLEHKRAISEAKKAQWADVEITDEIKDRLRKAALGNKNRLGKEASAETRERISAAQRGRRVSDETRAKMSAAHKARLAGKEQTPAQLEALAKAREKLKGRAAWNKGKTASDETKAKQSEAHKGKEPWNKGRKKPRVKKAKA